MKLGDKVFCKDIQCFGNIANINGLDILVYLIKIVEIEDRDHLIMNGDLTNSLQLSENKGRVGILYLAKKDFNIIYPRYKTRLYPTNINNVRIIK